MTGPAFDRLYALVQASDGRGNAQTLMAALTQVQNECVALQRAHDAAVAANEAKTRFLASVSHEIRSPLNAIYGYAQLLERGDGHGALAAARVIRRSSEHLSYLIEGLLDISQVESGSLKLARDTIRLRPFLEQIIAMLDLQATARGVTLTLDCPAGLPEFVHADQNRLRQVLINLVSNAIKFTDAGSVTLRVHYRNELATFAVIDTGIGIAPDDAARIFAPFERVTDGGEARPGIGLGLAITQALVRIMGGDIAVESALGQGACFTVRLMLSQPMAPPAEITDPGAVFGFTGRARRLLLIDDDPAQRALLTGLFKPLGFRVECAADGAAGLALAARVQPDLVLLDVALPGSSGWDIAATLRRRYGPGLRIIMLSGERERSPMAGDGGAVRGVSPGDPRAHDAFITKPFAFNHLLDVVGNQLAIEWLHSGPSNTFAGAAHAVSLPPLLCGAARAHFAAIEKLVRIGHVRAIEAEIDAIANLGPDAAPVADRLRGWLDSFDLRALANFARAAGVDTATHSSLDR